MHSDPMLNRIRMITMAVVLIVLVWQLSSLFQYWLLGVTAVPRAITPRADLTQDEQSTISVFEHASPSVVFITTTQRLVNHWTRNVRRTSKGTGSGFIWDRLGHVVTNNHVIAQASEAIVRLNDGRSYQASLVGASPQHDLAVLKINVSIDQPPPVPIGTSHDLKVGQKVYAIGNPFGLDYTLTAGVVSALDRSLNEENGVNIEHLIQTDAAINPGNSGGPLLDSAGRLIGINTAIYSPSGAYAGIGFSVPVDTVNKVIPQLIAKGRYIRPSLGISIDHSVNKAVMRQLGLSGVVVIKVSPGSAADRAGLQGAKVDRYGSILLGDIITAVDAHAVESVGVLLNVLDDYSVNDQVTLTIIRDNQEQSVRLTLQASE